MERSERVQDGLTLANAREETHQLATEYARWVSLRSTHPTNDPFSPPAPRFLAAQRHRTVVRIIEPLRVHHLGGEVHVDVRHDELPVGVAHRRVFEAAVLRAPLRQ